MTKLDDALAAAGDLLTARVVYGEPYEQDGATLVPAAAVRGGRCGGSEAGADSTGCCDGGSCMMARPVGAYRIKDGDVSWIPATDRTKVAIIAGLFGTVALLVLRSVLRRG